MRFKPAIDSIGPPLRFLLTLTAALSGAILAVRAITGPFHFLVSVRSPISAESVFAVSIIGLIWSGMHGRSPYAPAGPGWSLKHLGIALALVAAAFYGVTRLYFFGDDFFVVRDAVDLERGRQFLRSLVAYSKGEVYYRPAGYFLLWLSSLPLGLDPAKWHLLNVLLHLTNCALLYGVSLRLGFLPSTAFLAALLFGIHGSRCEAVVWIGGYFELLSLFFVLVTLLLYLRWQQSADRWARMVAVCCFVLGMWSKESAYALPLVLFILPWHENETWSRRIRSVAPFFVVAGLAFVQRWMIIGGVGGYVDPASGRPEAATINLFRIGKLLTARLWAILIFPIDWDVKPGLLLAGAIIAMMVAMLCASRLRGSHPLLIFAVGATLISALPASSQLLISSDMNKSRTLYLPSLGFSLLVCVLVERIPRIAIRRAVAAALVLFHFAALRHNIAIWEDVSRISRATCSQGRSLVEGGPRDVTVVGIPGTINGVYFFMNGFAECLELGRPEEWRVTLLPAGTAPPTQPRNTVLVWRNAKDGLVKIR